MPDGGEGREREILNFAVMNFTQFLREGDVNVGVTSLSNS